VKESVKAAKTEDNKASFGYENKKPASSSQNKKGVRGKEFLLNTERRFSSRNRFVSSDS